MDPYKLVRTLTFKQMATMVYAIMTEAKRRNPIGINIYIPPIKRAAALLDEIAEGEKYRRTAESGPKEQ